jgi:hypothetical protein
VFAPLLVDFLFRLTFGVAVAMALTPSRWVTSGFFRVHLWMLLGVQTLAALAAYSGDAWPFRLAAVGAIASYVGAVIWMYERRLPGKTAIVLVALCALVGVITAIMPPDSSPGGNEIEIAALLVADRIASGLLLGFVTASMLLGHWYLNTPTMKLEPLKRLIIFVAIAALARMGLCALGVWLEYDRHIAGTNLMPLTTWGLFLALRWLSGLIGVLFLAWLTWQTLKIPNTQSATGILYAAVVLVFIGELTSQLLSAQSLYPV